MMTVQVEVWQVLPGKRFLDERQREFLMIKLTAFMSITPGYVVAVHVATGEPKIFESSSLVTPIGE